MALIDAETARRIAATSDATLAAVLTDPVSGTLLDYGTRVYRPRVTRPACSGPRPSVLFFQGAGLSARRCRDLDHGVPYPHGPTCEADLIPLCRHHQRAKTHGGWRWRRDDEGTVIWTAPTGHKVRGTGTAGARQKPPF